jgi:cytosine/adenosine deaminase-related metal-dependent hydrolase
MSKILIRGGDLLTMDPALGDISRGSLLIEGDRIAAVGQVLDASGAEVVDASGMIVLPGFVDAHIHVWQTGLRGLAGDWSLADYSRHMHLNLARHFTPEDLYLAALVGGWNHLNAGVTALFDFCHNNPTPEHSDRAIDGLSDSGVRAVFGHGTARWGEDGDTHPGTLPHPKEEVRRLRLGRLHDDGALVTMGLAIRGPDQTPYDVAAKDIRLALEHGMVASSHLAGRLVREVPDAVPRLHADGLLGPHFNAVHANQLTDDDLHLLAASGATVTV